MTATDLKPVVLAAYDAAWPVRFAELRSVYGAALGVLARSIEHIGSTAVPGLLAKPIIDIDIVISSRAAMPQVISGLGALGYRHRGDQGVPGREAFARDGFDDVPRDGSGRRWPSHNLYVCAQDAEELRRHLVFRDRLRADPETAAAYAALKQRLAAIHRDDRDAYCDAKSEFVEAIVRAGGEVTMGAPGGVKP